VKATFEFSLPEEIEEYETYRRAPDYERALRELREWLRGRRKHHDGDTNADDVWYEFHAICEGFANDL
jgi:hypothetical protein